MRMTSIGTLVTVATLSVFAAAQTTGPAAPKDRAVDFPSADLEKVERDIAAKGLITQRVLEGGVFSVNVRHIAGAETGLVHGRITEISCTFLRAFRTASRSRKGSRT